MLPYKAETFLITLKSKPILIKIFSTLTIKHQVLGSPLTGRDLLIGFDLLHQIPSLRWSSKGLMHKQHLLTWTQVPHLFTVDPFDSLKLQIINDYCANSHSEFLFKNPNPLWKNPKFFKYLPFKKVARRRQSFQCGTLQIKNNYKCNTSSRQKLSPQLYFGLSIGTIKIFGS